MLRHLKWLQVEALILDKISIHCFKCQTGLAPSYLTHLIQSYIPHDSLKSGNLALLSVPFRPNKKTRERHLYTVLLKYGIYILSLCGGHLCLNHLITSFFKYFRKHYIQFYVISIAIFKCQSWLLAKIF